MEGIFTTPLKRFSPSFVTRARARLDIHNLNGELADLKETFLQNNYSPDDITWAMNRLVVGRKPYVRDDFGGFTFTPYHGAVSWRISHFLGSFGIKAIFCCSIKIEQMLRLVKDDLGQTQWIYRIPCKCGLCNIGQTSPMVADICKEHLWWIRICHPEKSALAKHSIQNEHEALVSSIKVLAKLAFSGIGLF